MTEQERDRLDRNGPTAECVPIEEIGAVLGRDPGDAARRHVETCPRCRALAQELAAFEGEPELAPADGPVVAELERMLSDDIMAGAAAGPKSASWWRAGGWRPALVAVAAVLAFVVVIPLVNRSGDGDPVLRGPGDETGFFTGVPTADPRGSGTDRAVEFRWDPQAGADGYRLEIYDTGLATITTVEAGSTTSLRWVEAELPEGRAPAAWRIVVLERGDAVGRSGLLPYPTAAGR